MQQLGLEWFFRFIQEPRRLWRRYLLGNPQFVFKVIGQWLGLKSYPLPQQVQESTPDDAPGTRSAGQPKIDILPIKPEP
jgi:hypothetical protein